MVDTTHLYHHHRSTAEAILSHPVSHNIEWRDVLSLLKAIGEVNEEHDGKVKVTVGPETEVLRAPHGKDIDPQMVVDLRRMLTEAGLGAPDAMPQPDERTRDHGDSRWGEPTQ